MGGDLGYCKSPETDLACRLELDQSCWYHAKYGSWNQPTFVYNDKNWFDLLEISSSLIGSIFFMSLFFIKPLQQHPMNIIMWNALAESLFQMLLVMQFWVCRLELNRIFAYTVYFKTDKYHVLKASNVLWTSCNFLSNFFYSASLMLNFWLCIDLILMIRNPFAPKEKRVMWYYFATIVWSLCQAYVFSTKVELNTWQFWADDFLAGFGIVSLFVAYIISTVYACRKLRGPGISKAIR